FSNVIDDFKKITAAHVGSQAALLAYLKIGNFYAEQGRLDEAILAYQAALNSTDQRFYKILIYYNLGYLQEQKGNHEQAIGWFKKITDMKKQRLLFWSIGYRPNVFWLSQAYFGMGRCYDQLKQVELAKDAYLRISDEFPNTPYADQAQVHAQFVKP
ncbi:MAG: tetratricopeptide repeat protein, partial [Deltaproteobacteria bacterium]|nr:tetratricopeptide repeat protein [Deltaproteobacteria bacterium]